MEVFGRLERILSIMPSRTARWFALALVVFLFAQPIPFLAFAQDASDGSCCCKDKSMSCCRRSHHHAGSESGPAFSSRDCCGQCQVSVRKSQPVAATVVPATARRELAPAISPLPARLTWIPCARRDAALFQRPPPSAV